MKKRFSFLIAILCVVVVFLPFFAATATASGSEAEAVVTVTQLDAATASDAQSKQAASMTDISVDIPAGESAPVVKVGENTVTGGTLPWNEGEDITFTVMSTQPCIFLYESGSTGLVTMSAVKQSANVYTFTTPVWLDMKVYFSVKGDADASGSVDMSDVASVENTILSGSQPTGKTLLYTDTNGDGVIDTKDLTALKAEVKGIRDLSW